MTIVEDAVANDTEQATGSSDQFAEKAAQVKDLLAELAQLAPSAASEQLVALKQSASWLYEAGADELKKAGTKVVETVKNRPLQTALVGAGIGLLAWWLVARRKDG